MTSSISIISYNTLLNTAATTLFVPYISVHDTKLQGKNGKSTGCP